MIYCVKSKFGQIFRSLSFNGGAIGLKRSKKSVSNWLSLATIGQVRQAATLQKRHWPLAAVSLTAAVFLLEAAWIPVKAEVAQFLLARSWLETRAGAADAKPWPWADTRAIGVLEMPRLGIREYVLEGSSGRNLAFGPALVNTTPIDKTRDLILSGHRDTHFSFLRKLRNGDLLRLETTAGSREYRVTLVQTIDSREQQLVIDDSVERLTLVTCYPFNAATAGGPLRRVVTALPSLGED